MNCYKLLLTHSMSKHNSTLTLSCPPWLVLEHDRLQMGKPPWYVTNHSGLCSLLLSSDWETSITTPRCSDALCLCNKGRLAHSICGCKCGRQVKLLTCDIPERLIHESYSVQSAIQMSCLLYLLA